MKAKKRVIIVVLCTTALGVSAAGFVVSHLRGSTAEALMTERVKRGDIYRTVTATGKIEPRTKVQIKSKASGIVQFIYVREGEIVRKGQALLDLDRDSLQSRWKGAKAALSISEALEREAAAEVTTAMANVERARYEASVREHELAFTENEYARKKKLFEEALISRAEVESCEKQLSQARASRQALLAGIDVAEAQLRRSRLAVERSKAAIAQAQASVEQAQEELDNASIRSPIDGIVLARRVEVGDAVSSILTHGAMAPLLMELGDTTQLFVSALVNESDIAQIYLNQAAFLTIESLRDRRFEGRVSRIAPRGSEANNVINFEVEITFNGASAPSALKASMSVTAELILDARRGVLLIPEATVQYDDSRRASVDMPAVDTPGKTHRVPVELGISDGIRVEVRRGLTEGQVIAARR
jgi:HlyD family secretion protein